VPDIGKLLWPKSVAVVGASSDKRGLRGRIVEVICAHPFAGRIYPVSRSAAEIHGMKAYPSIEALPERADLAVLIIPAEYVPAELERCGRAGVAAAIILSSGFAEEKGETGARMQRAIADIARRYDMAVSGPNNEGFANIPAALCATFSPAVEKSAGPLVPPRALAKGQISVVSQSGGLGFALFDRARTRNLRSRFVVTTGNEGMLEVADFLDYLLQEGESDVILLLIEAVRTAEKFIGAAEKALRAGKPLIVCKIGQSAPGVRAVASHTAALAGSQAAYRAVFEHYGIIEARDFDEMLDIAAGFLTCADRMPAGRRVGISTSSGGAGVWMADACAAAGLDVPVLDDATRAAIDAHLPSYGTSQNPVDATAQGVHKLGYAQFARILTQSPTIDGVIVVITARRATFLENDLPKLKDLARESTKPVLMWSYTLPIERSVEILDEAGFPLFVSAHGCARAMRMMADYRELRDTARSRSDDATSHLPVPAKARAMLAESGSVLCEYQALQLLSACGVAGGSVGSLAKSAEEAVAAAQAAGRPVALKVQSADIPHKTDAGAVALNLVGADAVRAAYDRVLVAAKRHCPAAHIEGVLVQPMAPPGREVILGVNRDATWGPLLMVGLGGVLVEAIGDVVLAPVPLDAVAARALIGRLKGTLVFERYRAWPPADTEALTDLMVKLSHFAAKCADDIAEIDLNPVIVHGQGEGVSIVDALIVKRDGQAASRHRATG